MQSPAWAWHVDGSGSALANRTTDVPIQLQIVGARTDQLILNDQPLPRAPSNPPNVSDSDARVAIMVCKHSATAAFYLRGENPRAERIGP